MIRENIIVIILTALMTIFTAIFFVLVLFQERRISKLLNSNKKRSIYYKFTALIAAAMPVINIILYIVNRSDLSYLEDDKF